MKVVICGGGIIGNCTAYFLLKNNVQCTVIEKTKVACAASGKAGGFLARDWCKSDGALNELTEVSFDLHQTLAQELNGQEVYDYRRLDAYSVSIKETPSNRSAHTRDNVGWANGTHIDRKSLHCIGTKDTIAQLHPYKFTTALCNYCKSKGVTFIEGETVCGIKFHQKKLTGIELKSGLKIDCDVVVLCMGPWTGAAAKWIPNLPSVHGQKAHSITIAPKHPVPAEALFTEYGEKYSPEIYPRPDGEVYVCGMAENPVPSSNMPPPDDIVPTENSCEKIKEMTDLVGDSLKEGKVTKSQACYLPLTQDGFPMIGKISDLNGVYIGAGHGCWGILNAPATGCSLAQLITTGRSDIDLSPFDPNRFV